MKKRHHKKCMMAEKYVRDSAVTPVKFKGFDDDDDRMWGLTMKRLQRLKGDNDRLSWS